MSWKLHDEWIDLAQARHVVIYRNSQTGAEHQLIHDIGVPACPHCGRVNEATEPLDFAARKDQELSALNAHHKTVLQYREKHKHVDLRSARKQ